jgi:hypothetical protein
MRGQVENKKREIFENQGVLVRDSALPEAIGAKRKISRTVPLRLPPGRLVPSSKVRLWVAA